MSYMNDPREMAIRPESGVTLEQDNRVETMYHWGAMVTDLCDLPVSEYMKPITVIAYGAFKTKNVKIWFTVLKNGNEITDEPETDFTAGEDAENIWTAHWEWTGTFSNSVQVAAVVQTDQGTYNVSAILNDNEEKSYEKEITEAKGSEAIISYKSYGVASTKTPVKNVTGLTYTEIVIDENIKYKFEISSAETIVYLTLKLVGATSYTNMKMRYGDEIPFDKVSIEKEGYDFLYWADSNGKEYTGTTMPAQNLTLTAKYEAKTAPVYYGVFITSSTTADSRIFNINDLKQYFKTVKVNDCLDGKDVVIEMAIDPELLDPSLSDREFEEYQSLHLYPACFLIPVDADEKYEFIAILKADNNQKNFVTDGVDIDIEGNKYHLYTYLNPDSMKAQDFKQNWKYNITLK